MSIKQLFEAERKIRCLSLLEQNVMNKMTCLVLPLNIGENSEVEANDAWLKDFVLAASAGLTIRQSRHVPTGQAKIQASLKSVEI